VPRAIVYLRVSTDEQAESSLGLEAQVAACRATAERLKLAIASTFQDDVSGGLPLARRPVLIDAIAALEPGDILLVAKRDRLSRGDALATGTIELAVQRAGARIISASGEGTESDDPSSILMRRLIDAFAEYERLIIKARTRAALRAKRARNERRGSVPYGARIDPDHPARSRKSGLPGGLVVDQAELDALGSIRRWKSEGASLRVIARKLDEAGVPTKSGRPWSHATVQGLLRRADDAEA
jgi:DNA invertase Pin-like site-specific DNA recombinase